MLDLEEPRTNRALYAALNEMYKNKDDLSVSLEKMLKITGCPGNSSAVS